MSQEKQPARIATRAPVRKTVKLQFDDSVNVTQGLCRNISIGGMLVGVQEPRAQGTLVRFELEIEEGLSIRGLGEVIWMRPSANAEREPEMGIKFRFLEQRDRQMILKLVSQHIKERLEKKHPGEEGAVSGTAAPAPSPALATLIPPPDTPAPPISPGVSFEDEPTISLEEPASPSEAVAAPMPLKTPLDGADAFEMRPEEAGELKHSYQPPPPAYRGRRIAGSPAAGSPAAGRPKRPSQRRDFPLLPVVALLLVVAVAVVFLYRDELFGPPAPEPPENAAPVASTDSAPGPPAPAGTPAGSIEPIGPGVSPENLTEPPPLSMAQDSPPAAAQRAPAPPRSSTPKPPPTPTPSAAAAPFNRVLEISWSRRPGGVRIEVKTNGSISPNRYQHFRLDGETPREVVKLLGVAQRYEPDEIRITGAAVEKIRVGYHANKELHLVLDMLDRSSRLSRIQTDGSMLVLIID